MEEQLEVSDVLVVNKLDLISVEDRDALKNQLNEVNKYSSKYILLMDKLISRSCHNFVIN